MRQALLLLLALFVIPAAWAAPMTNVALGKPVTVEGLCGGDPNVVTDGQFWSWYPWQENSVWWYGSAATIYIDLEGTFTISSAIVQADDNDSYMLQYQDASGVYHDWWGVPDVGGWGLTNRPIRWDNYTQQSLPTVTATGLRIYATGGDGSYSVSEVQAFGISAVPEPSSVLLLGTGGLLLARLRRRRRAG